MQLVEGIGHAFCLGPSCRSCSRHISAQQKKKEHEIASGIKREKRRRALGPRWRVAASSQIHLHRFLVGGLCNLLLDTRQHTNQRIWLHAECCICKILVQLTRADLLTLVATLDFSMCIEYCSQVALFLLTRPSVQRIIFKLTCQNLLSSL